MWEHIKVSENILVEEDIEEIIGMKFITEEVAEIGLEKDIRVILERETGVVVIVDQGQDQEQVQIEIELGVMSVDNMITSQKTTLQLKKRDR